MGASLQDELQKRVGGQPLGLCGPTVPVPVLLLATLPNQCPLPLWVLPWPQALGQGECGTSREGPDAGRTHRNGCHLPRARDGQAATALSHTILVNPDNTGGPDSHGGRP